MDEDRIGHAETRDVLRQLAVIQGELNEAEQIFDVGITRLVEVVNNFNQPPAIRLRVCESLVRHKQRMAGIVGLEDAIAYLTTGEGPGASIDDGNQPPNTSIEEA